MRVKGIISALGLSLFMAMPLAAQDRQAAPELSLTEWGPENGLGQFVIFTANGQVKIWGGCDWVEGQYVQSRDRVDIILTTETEPSCEDLAGAQSAFVSGLKRVKSLQMRLGELELLNKNGDVTLRLRRRDLGI